MHSIDEKKKIRHRIDILQRNWRCLPDHTDSNLCVNMYTHAVHRSCGSNITLYWHIVSIAIAKHSNTTPIRQDLYYLSIPIRDIYCTVLNKGFHQFFVTLQKLAKTYHEVVYKLAQYNWELSVPCIYVVHCILRRIKDYLCCQQHFCAWGDHTIALILLSY